MSRSSLTRASSLLTRRSSSSSVLNTPLPRNASSPSISNSRTHLRSMSGIGISFLAPPSVSRVLGSKPPFETSAFSSAPHPRRHPASLRETTPGNPFPPDSGHTSEISVSSTSRAAGSKPIIVPAPERWEVHPSHQSGRDEPRRTTMESALPKILVLKAALRSPQRSSGALSYRVMIRLSRFKLCYWRPLEAPVCEYLVSF